MSFTIKSIDETGPEEGKNYLFDSNVWMYILIAPHNPTAIEQAYINFFDAIINLSSNPMCKRKPFIYINGLIYSEVYNAFMKSQWEAYKETSDPTLPFKSYRTTDNYTANLSAIKSDFRAHKQYLTIDTDLIVPPDQILSEVQLFSDFNDHYYFKIAQSKNLAIVTNDGDFKYPGVEILTKNYNLLRLPH